MVKTLKQDGWGSDTGTRTEGPIFVCITFEGMHKPIVRGFYRLISSGVEGEKILPQVLYSQCCVNRYNSFLPKQTHVMGIPKESERETPHSPRGKSSFSHALLTASISVSPCIQPAVITVLVAGIGPNLCRHLQNRPAGPSKISMLLCL